MSKRSEHYLCLAPLLLMAAAPAQAYIGPGLGAGTIGVILGLVGSILIAVFAFFWYPIKRKYKAWTGADAEAVEEEEQPMEVAKEQD